ncbi:methionine gamma-lyase [Halobacillus litoralis]|uniref:methionine gamma-lyase n=1 Tax=Halobacillus litoralis TaxID=45668 RepID=UPI001CD6A145|nr:methionine gamma-lyase [Halobacillus litoralis]MCA0971147.1 methionine gamma-lyase [Halobacillus litoralis]
MKRRIESEMIHGGAKDGRSYEGSLTVPIFQTSTFSFSSAEQGERRFAAEEEGFIYSRLGNPTVRALEERMAVLEEGEKGLAFSSGMAAVSAVLTSLTKAGDHILCSNGLYGCTFGLLQWLNEKYQITHSFSSMESETSLRESLAERTPACIFIETPVNPTMKVLNLKMVAKVARELGIPVIVDNTFCSPYLQQPLSLGCDVVVHSATKYISGHGDVVAGLVIGKEDYMTLLAKREQKDVGGVLSPFDAWLLLRGVKTLHVRMEGHCQSAKWLADKLKNHPKVENIYYPGSRDEEEKNIVEQQMRLAGGVLSFDIKGTKAHAQKMMNELKMIKIAVSLGDAETLIQHPATMTHAVIPAERRQQMGITDTMLRLSVGLEAVEDIWDDLKQALEWEDLS